MLLVLILGPGFLFLSESKLVPADRSLRLYGQFAFLLIAHELGLIASQSALR